MKTPEEITRLLGPMPAANLPLALFPVHIQTRFVTREGQPLLLVRVYPDLAHVDSHERPLTSPEVDWGKRYWELIWPEPRDRDLQQRAWGQIVDRFGARRSAWVVEKMTPTNLAQRPNSPPVFPNPGPLKADSWTQPALARMLPERWVVAGYAGGQRVLFEAGLPVIEPLAVSLSPDDPTIPPPDEDALAIDEGTRWMFDFDEALRVGMAVRIPLPPELQGVKFERILVFGVKGGLNAAQSATLLEDQLDAHHYTHGLGILTPGTPTNNSAGASTGFSRREPGGRESFTVEVRPPQVTAGSDGVLTARLLGIRPKTMSAVEGASQAENLGAKAMLAALWDVTGRYYLEQILAQPEGEEPAITPVEMDQARRFCLDFVRPGGPLPALRIGAQPYGLLPVQSFNSPADSPAAKNRFFQVLLRLKSAWRSALARTPRLSPGSQSADELMEVLRMQPVSAGFRARLAFDKQFFLPTGIVQREMHPDLRAHAVVLRSRLRQLSVEPLVGEGRVYDLLPADTARLLAAPLVQAGGEIPGAPLAPNYIQFLRGASFDDILNEKFPASDAESNPPPPDNLLYLLLRQSILLAYTNVAARILARRGSLARPFVREPALVDILGSIKPARSRTLLRVIDLDPALRASIHTLTAAQEPEASELEELRASLAHLEKLPVDVLARLMNSCLDLFAYRLDAWFTSMATRRLVELRAAKARGLGIGAFGWAEDLESAPRAIVPSPPGEEGQPLFAAREKGGYIHAPSIGQAATAAVMRSGYLSQPGEGGSRPFAVDLSSQRMRIAQWLLDGVRQGQPLGALLGYRFERGLHDRHLDRFIDGFRRVSLLSAVYAASASLREALALPPGQPRIVAVRAAQTALADAREALNRRYQFPIDAQVGALEKVSAARVADGLALSRLFEAGSLDFNDVVPPGGQSISSAERSGLEAELRSLQAAVDSLSDALTAEGVYNLVRGNPARAAASVDAVAHGEIQPPDLTFGETPRPGAAITHRLVVIFSGAAPVPPAGARQFRGRAEPRLNAWLQQMLGSLANAICLAEFVNDSGKVIGAQRRLPLSSLGISPIDAIYLSAASQPGRPSDLERLLEYRLRETAPATVPESAALRFIYKRPATGIGVTQLSLGQFLELAAAFRQAVMGARPVQGRDLAKSEKDPPSGVNAAEYKTRADQAVTALTQAAARLTTQRTVAANASGPALAAALSALRERLLDLFHMGFTDALPFSARGSTPARREELVLQAQAVEQEIRRQLDQIQAATAGFNRAAATPEEQVDHDLARFKGVFGRSFLALPQVKPGNGAELGKAFLASPGLLGGDPLQAFSWLQAAGRVRPAVSHLEVALSYAAALARTGALELRVAQLPFLAGERWVGLPFAPGKTFPSEKLSLVAHLPQPFKPTQPLAGFMVDAWVETVPVPEVTSGMAFNYDAPGARPPQAILLAVPPAGTKVWDVEILEQTLLDASELARLRAVDPQALSQDVILQRMLPALYVSANLSGDTLSTDFARAFR